MRRITHNDWFIQSKKGKDDKYMAWASKDRTNSPIDPSIGDIYFDFGDTEIEAIEKIKIEIDKLLKNR